MLINFHIKTLAWKSKDFEIISYSLVLKVSAVTRLWLFTETVAAVQIFSENGCP